MINFYGERICINLLTVVNNDQNCVWKYFFIYLILPIPAHMVYVDLEKSLYKYFSSRVFLICLTEMTETMSYLCGYRISINHLTSNNDRSGCG